MRRGLSIVLAGLLASLAIACVNIQVETLSPEGISYPRVPTDSVRVFYPPALTASLNEFRGGEPALLTTLGEYTRIARLNGDGDDSNLGDKDVDDVIRELRKKAGELGANAIYIEFATAKVVRKTCSPDNDGGDTLLGAAIAGVADAINDATCDPRAGRTAEARALAIRSESFFLP